MRNTHGNQLFTGGGCENRSYYMTPTKDTLEATNSVDEASAQANTKAKPDASRMRADAVSLEVPVKVHGSRVKEVVMGTTPHTEPFEEQTTTMIVFPQGGVLKMSTTVGAGQMMVVTNLKSGHDAICRVVKVRAYGQGQSYVEIEFTHRQAGYWGVYFPSDGPEAASQPPATTVASSARPISVDVKVEKTEEKASHEVSVAPPAAVKPTAPKPAAKPDSAFAQIGSQEDVQPAAASTSTRVRPSPLVEAELNRGRDTATKAPAVESPRVSVPPPSSPAPSLSLNELQGDARASSSSLSFAGAGVPGEVADEIEEAPAETLHAQVGESSAPTFGRLAATASLGSSNASAREFGSGLGTSSLSMSGHEVESSGAKKTNWLAIAASAIATVALGLGAAFFLHLPPFAAQSAKSAVPALAPAAPPVETTTESNPAAQPVNSAPVQSAPVNQPAPSSVTAAAPVVAHTSQPVQSSKSSRPSASAPAPALAVATETPKSAAKVPDMFGALNAHPTSHSHSADSGQTDAPSLDASATPENIGGLPSLSSGPAAPAAAPAAGTPAPVEHRVRVGGQIKPPRLVSTVLPEYPAMARNAGVEGDVVVDTTIDENGKVATMKVISGPVLLRQAALDALRRWKYEPSKLNGEPVQVQMTVTIKFHRQ
jgi:periplasmic protein TonB